MTRWINSVTHIVNGEPVNSAVTSRPDRWAENNIRNLKERLDQLSAATALHDFDAPTASTVVKGTPVYWNATSSRYEPALAAATVDSSGQLTLADSANVWGICVIKHSAGVGDILLLGLTDADISAAVDAELEAGRYFLSGTTPGKLVKQQPAIGIPVLLYQDGKTFVQTLPNSFLLSRLDYAIELFALPAGTVTEIETGDDQTIAVADVDAEGWLPADHESFQDLAPEGAVFGYNLATHPELQAIWPPSPIESARIAVERPPLVEDVMLPWVGETIMGPETVRIDANGIWWFNNNYNRAPWPVSYQNPSVGSSSSSSVVEEDPSSCEPEHAMHIKLYFGRMQFANNNFAVTSLQSASDALVITNCNGLPATTGDLKASIDLGLAVGETPVTGYSVLKSVTGQSFQKGNVLEGLIIRGDNITVSASTTRYLTPDDATSDVVHQGIVEIAVSTEPGNRELAPEIIKLGNTRERHHAATGIPYIGFPAGVVSSVNLVFQVPLTGLPASPVLVVRTLVLGLANGDLPALTMTYVKTSIPEDVETAVAMPDDTDITAITYDVAQGIAADNYVMVKSGEIALTAGDTVYVKIDRADDDAYTGELGLLRIDGVIQGASS